MGSAYEKEPARRRDDSRQLFPVIPTRASRWFQDAGGSLRLLRGGPDPQLGLDANAQRLQGGPGDRAGIGAPAHEQLELAVELDHTTAAGAHGQVSLELGAGGRVGLMVDRKSTRL